jgi:Flp pilus assembly protein TadD
MMRYHRLPAALILSLFTAAAMLCLRYPLRATGAASGDATGSLSFEESQIAIGKAKPSPQDWLCYAQALMDRQQFADAAAAYQRALDLNPADRRTPLYLALALAQSGNDERLLRVLKDLVLIDPKSVREVLERPECGKAMAQARFQSLAQEARWQAMD